MSFPLPKPKSITDEEVVLSRDDWDRLVSVLSEDNGAEDEDDLAAVLGAREDDARFIARVSAERGEAHEALIPIEVVRAKLDGAHPLRAWRDHRGWTEDVLARKAGVGRDVIVQIETRRDKGSVAPLHRLAHALQIPLESLVDEQHRREEQDEFAAPP